MKRFWLVLLSLGLVMAFSSSVFAADVKFSGSFYASGIYLDKINLNDGSNVSTAFYHQRLRVNMDFIVTPALKLVTRFDAMERIWGQERRRGGMFTDDAQSVGSQWENENIAFDIAYIQYVSAIGMFEVGYQVNNRWGTVFGDNGEGPTAGIIKYTIMKGPLAAAVGIFKEGEWSHNARRSSVRTDLDDDKYIAAVVYFFKGGNAGVLYSYSRKAASKATTYVYANEGYMAYIHTIQPYFKAKVGPVALEGELWYMFGKAPDWERLHAATGPDVSIKAWKAYINAVADLGMFYVGGTAAWISGDKPGTLDVKEGLTGGGIDWNPCLIMFNQDMTYWVGALPGWNGTANASEMMNAWFGQIKGGVRPIADLDLGASFSYAKADQLPTSVLKKEYGYELDVTATYKITNNLSYMLGVGYLWTGDYYKGSDLTQDVKNTYLVINKLTLTF